MCGYLIPFLSKHPKRLTGAFVSFKGENEMNYYNEYKFNQLGLVTVMVAVFSLALINSCGV